MDCDATSKRVSGIDVFESVFFFERLNRKDTGGR